MSQAQWGHGYHSGIKDAKRAILIESAVGKHRVDCVCIGCRYHPCGMGCNEESCVIHCVLYSNRPNPRLKGI